MYNHLYRILRTLTCRTYNSLALALKLTLRPHLPPKSFCHAQFARLPPERPTALEPPLRRRNLPLHELAHHVFRSSNASLQCQRPHGNLPQQLLPRSPPHRAGTHGVPRDQRARGRRSIQRKQTTTGTDVSEQQLFRISRSLSYRNSGNSPRRTAARDGRRGGAGCCVLSFGDAGVSCWTGLGGAVCCCFLLPSRKVTDIPKNDKILTVHCSDFPANGRASTIPWM